MFPKSLPLQEQRMSRADWSFLEHLLEEGQEYSTGVGRVWLTVLFLFRMLVLGAAVESAWDDEQEDFVCNTRQPGCTAVCYDRAFPISHFRYFVLQVIFVSTPTIFYFGYVALRFGGGRKEEGDKCKKGVEDGCSGRRTLGVIVEEEEGKNDLDSTEEKKKGVNRRVVLSSAPEGPKLKGRLLCAYALSIIVKVLLEAGFILGLWFLYDGLILAPKFECNGSPCPHTVDCFVSRPTEKTIFTIYTQVIAAISLLLNLIELLHLLQLAISHRLEKRYRGEQVRCPRGGQRDTPVELQTKAMPTSNAGPPSQVDVGQGRNPCETREELVIEVNRGPAEDEGDSLPSYTNCVAAMRTTHVPRVHYKKHAPPASAGANVKAPHLHKGRGKLKHYV